jgi:hypothetical protein
MKPTKVVYYERKLPVRILRAWDPRERGGPRNVLVERADGKRVVRPFRGLRRDDSYNRQG